MRTPLVVQAASVPPGCDAAMPRDMKRAQKKAEKQKRRAKEAKKINNLRRVHERTVKQTMKPPELIETEKSVPYQQITPWLVNVERLVTRPDQSIMVQQLFHTTCTDFYTYEYETEIRDNLEKYATFSEQSGIKVKMAAIQGVVAAVKFGWTTDELMMHFPEEAMMLNRAEREKLAEQKLHSILLINPQIFDPKTEKMHPLQSSHVWFDMRNIAASLEEPIDIHLYDVLSLEGYIQRYETKGLHGNVTKRWGFSLWHPVYSRQTYTHKRKLLTTPPDIDRLCLLIHKDKDSDVIETMERDAYETELKELAGFRSKEQIAVMSEKFFQK